MTRIDAARESAAHYTDEAWQKVAPRIGSAVEHARRAAGSTVEDRVVPLWTLARANAQPAVNDAVGRAAELSRTAAAQARTAAAGAAAQVREKAVPAVNQAALEVRDRGAATVPVLRGQVSLADIEALTESRRPGRRWARRLLRLALLGAAVGGGVAGWKSWQRQNNPDWLVEPSGSSIPLHEPAAGPAAATHDSVNGSARAGSTPSGASKDAPADRDTPAVDDQAPRQDAKPGAAPGAKKDEPASGPAAKGKGGQPPKA